MKQKLFLLTLLLVPLFSSGQGIKRPNEIKIPSIDTFILIGSDTVSINDLNSVSYNNYRLMFKEYLEANINHKIKVDTFGVIGIGSKYAIVDEIFAKNDLQNDKAKDSIIQVQKKTIVEQKGQLARNNTIINFQSKQISDLHERYVAMSTMVVMCERDRKGEKKLRKIFQGAFYVMCGVAFFLGVN